MAQDPRRKWPFFSKAYDRWTAFKETHPHGAVWLSRAVRFGAIGGAVSLAGLATMGTVGLLLPATTAMGSAGFLGGVAAFGHAMFQGGIFFGAALSTISTTMGAAHSLNDHFEYRKKTPALINNMEQVYDGPRKAVFQLEAAQKEIIRLSAGFNRVAGRSNEAIERDIQKIVDKTAHARAQVRTYEIGADGVQRPAAFKFARTKATKLPKPKTP